MERRQFTRKAIDLPVICRIENPSPVMVDAKTVDISQGGLGIRFDKPVSASGVVSVKIIDRSSGIELEAEGKIAWHKTLDTGEGRMGIDFSKVAWTRLQELLKNS